MVEDQQWQEVFLQEVPSAECQAHKRLSWTIEFYLLEELFETLFAMLMLNIDIKPANLLNTTDTLHPEQKLILHTRLLFLSHALDLILGVPVIREITNLIITYRIIVYRHVLLWPMRLRVTPLCAHVVVNGG